MGIRVDVVHQRLDARPRQIAEALLEATERVSPEFIEPTLYDPDRRLEASLLRDNELADFVARELISTTHGQGESVVEYGLALASGGARGAYPAGALLLLAERGVRFDAVTGTSIGALNRAFYAQGDGSAEHLEKLCDLWRAMPDAGIIQISGSTAVRVLALLAARGIPWPVRLGLNRLVGKRVSILDPEPVEALLDELVDYAAVCSPEVS